ncbi:hypothetical protein CsatA_014425 [Cannabis sativa]
MTPLRSVLEGIITRRIILLYATTWTIMLTVTVAVASFAPEFAFVMAISPSSSFSKSCNSKGLVRIPFSDPLTEVICFPSHMVKRSKIDLIVPTVFAALVVTASACFVRSFALYGS